MRGLEKEILILFCGLILFFYIINYSGKERMGYIVDKRIDTTETKNRYIRDTNYGLSFYITYQEDKTMKRYEILVDKETYNNAEINTSNKIKF